MKLALIGLQPRLAAVLTLSEKGDMAEMAIGGCGF